MPEMARKLGKIMSEFRGTANEFKQTWQREVDFEEEKKAFDISDLEAEPIKRVESITVTETVTVTASEPAVREVDPEELEKLKAAASAQETPQTDTASADDPNDKRNWL
jgi:Sec-independent protein translocase protein TatA